MLIDNLTAKLYRTLPPLTNTIGQSCDPTSRISSANGNHYPDVGANTIFDSDIFVTVMVIGLTSLAHELQNIYEIYFCSSVGNGVGRGSRGKFCGLTTIVYSYL